ncbi:hypothetical protein I3760_08G045200 [Carya illinoinensis]|uniref:Uncharacterized protein n=1 Tax=Carya illinoinensis TaxID=32201 RepID=A0A922E8N4_CARIL|nr:hypothetical protein I3760_08G045200 [Carya illinoinensis]KAG6698941.1 hypothetical protein I3842_08G045000 [Carya illinoinensis]
MNGREANKAAPSADLLVCFPSRAHLTLMPKPICSPARPSETNKRHHNHRHHRGHLRRSSTRGGVQDSPLLWSKTKPMGSEISEPTSPKVTCAGQIKVRSKTSACNSWQSVMEEVERIHINGKKKKRPSWVETLGLKKDIMQFLTCLRSIRFDCRCFGTFRKSDITTEDEDGEEDGEYRENHVGFEGSDGNEASRTAFSKWFVVLQENQNNMLCKEDDEKEIERPSDDECIAAPPPNALLLMRCRSAPAKGWLEEKEEERQDEDEDEDEKGTGKGERKAKSLKCSIEGEKRTNKENMVVMKYDSDFYQISSSDVAKETWITGGMRDQPFSRSRSWKR